MPPAELGSVAKSGEGLAGKVLSERQPVLIERYGDLSSPQIGDTPPLPLTMCVLTSGEKYAALKERQQLARDLHDSVRQLIFFMSLVAQSIVPGFEQGKAEGEVRADRLLEIARLAQSEMKALLDELRGPSDEDKGSLAALAKAVERHCELTAPQYATVTVDINDENGLSESLKETLLRISQEALANALRHGGEKKSRFLFAATSRSYFF